MADFDINKLTPEEVEAIKSGGGFSGSFSGGMRIGTEASDRTPAVSIPISGYGTNLRPVVAGNEELVSKVDIEKYNLAALQREVERAEAQEAAEREREQLREVTDPKKLQASLQALSRKVNRLEKQLGELSKTIATKA